ncbi:hypothetical protein [Renibacterium salmoninarum]|uniref:hypothetical protein n=1 Tax=Renibacterium salmoninarum TaxID=1646 RepID=UPI000674D92F|nr:hypothetical protein [Renibacterium salmoninarum]
MRADHAGRGIGVALKLHQRQWALERELTEITWTFDPLASRNAYFNLVKLGADAQEYVIDFYGDMHDGVNEGQPSDRMIARWSLLAPLSDRATSGAGYLPVLRLGSEGQPQHESADSSVQRLAIGIPQDIESLRGERPEAARLWRHALREEMADRLQSGWRIAGFDKRGSYLLARG